MQLNVFWQIYFNHQVILILYLFPTLLKWPKPRFPGSDYSSICLIMHAFFIAHKAYFVSNVIYLQCSNIDYIKVYIICPILNKYPIYA